MWNISMLSTLHRGSNLLFENPKLTLEDRANGFYQMVLISSILAGIFTICMHAIEDCVIYVVDYNIYLKRKFYSS